MHDEICWLQQDSGVTIPGIKTACKGVTQLPLPGDTSSDVKGELFLLLADAGKAAADSFTVAIGGSKDLDKVAICRGDKLACITAKREDLTFSRASRTAGDIGFFTSASALALTPGLKVTLLGFDSKGIVTRAQSAQFDRAN